MSLVPESIRNHSTESLEKTFSYRLESLRIRQLIIDIENETSSYRLGLLLEMLNIDFSDIDIISMDEIQRRNLIRSYMSILRFSGTPFSVVALCIALGAASARIEKNYELKFNAESCYDGFHLYDKGRQYKEFSIDVIVKGVSDLNEFKTRFKNLFIATQPVRIDVRDIRIES